MDTTTVAHYPNHDHEPDEHPHGCYEGVVYFGCMVPDEETGDEVETFEAVPCRCCVNR